MMMMMMMMMMTWWWWSSSSYRVITHRTATRDGDPDSVRTAGRACIDKRLAEPFTAAARRCVAVESPR
jgi:hypothetical protein